MKSINPVSQWSCNGNSVYINKYGHAINVTSLEIKIDGLFFSCNKKPSSDIFCLFLEKTKGNKIKALKLTAEQIAKTNHHQHQYKKD